jgi:hypothetical protein
MVFLHPPLLRRCKPSAETCTVSFMLILFSDFLERAVCYQNCDRSWNSLGKTGNPRGLEVALGQSAYLSHRENGQQASRASEGISGRERLPSDCYESRYCRRLCALAKISQTGRIIEPRAPSHLDCGRYRQVVKVSPIICRASCRTTLRQMVDSILYRNMQCACSYIPQLITSL